MTKSLSWILNFTNELPSKEERIKCLQANPALKTILRYALDPQVKWLLPEGRPPFTPIDGDNKERALYAEQRKLYLFVEGGNDNLNQIKRERIFIEMLQELEADDADLLLNIKDGKWPYKNITVKLVREAYPGIF